MSTPDAGQLPALFPAPRSVTIAGRTIELKACSIAQAGRIIDAGNGLYRRVGEGAEFLELFDDYPAETSALIVAATGLDAEWVKSLDAVDRFALASEWMELNADFFVRRLLPSLARYQGALQAIGTGPTPSTTSSPPATSMPPTTPSKRRASMSSPSPNAVAASAASAS